MIIEPEVSGVEVPSPSSAFQSYSSTSYCCLRLLVRGNVVMMINHRNSFTYMMEILKIRLSVPSWPGWREHCLFGWVHWDLQEWTTLILNGETAEMSCCNLEEKTNKRREKRLFLRVHIRSLQGWANLAFRDQRELLSKGESNVIEERFLCAVLTDPPNRINDHN